MRRSLVRDLFVALGLEREWTDDDEALTEYMASAWLGHEHGVQAGKKIFDAEQEEAARPILQALGLADEVPPGAAAYDEVVVMGAAAIGMYRRIDIVRRCGTAAPQLTVLAGLRPNEHRDGGAGELLALDGRFAAAPGWAAPPLLARQHAALVDAGVDDAVASTVLFPHETALAELVLSKHFPALVVIETLHAPPHEVKNELGQREWFLRTWRADGPIPRLAILHGAPVEREDGPARPTSTSTFSEWLVLRPPARSTSNVLVVANQPHLARVRMQLLDLLDAAGRSDLDLAFAGSSVVPGSRVNLQLGEIPASILVESRRHAAD